MSANEFPVILVAIVGLIILLVVVGVLVASRYKVAGPNEAFIVTGRKGKEIRDVETGEVSTDLSGQKVVMGGGIFVVPFVQRLHVLDLSSRRIMIQIRGAVSGQGVKLNLDGVALVKVGGNEDSIRAAAQRFLTQQREIETFTQETLAGSLRSIVGSLTVEQIIRDRAAFAQRVADEKGGLACLVHLATGEIGQLLHEVRPVVRDRVGGVMAEPFDGFYREAALAQALEQHTVGAGGKAVGMGKHDQGHVVNPFGSGVLEKQQLLRWGGAPLIFLNEFGNGLF